MKEHVFSETEDEAIIARGIRLYDEKNYARWHTPGHKGKLCSSDITEIDDGEIFPSDFIEKAARKTASVYGAKHCRYLLGGSSMGIKAAVMSVGGNILAPKVRHRSFDEGALLARANVLEITCGEEEDGLLPLPTAVDVERAIRENPEANAVFIVSPDYYGRVVSGETAEIVRAAKKTLIVDSAHGAHFAFRRDLFAPDFSSVADFCVMSAHKTLSAPTMCSLMTCNNNALTEKLDFSLRLLGTTSPSYPLLSAIEKSVDYAKKNAPRYDELKSAIERLTAEINCLKNADFTRIVVSAASYGMTGKELFDEMRKTGHVAETYDPNYTVFIVTLSDCAKDVDGLRVALNKAVKKI